MSVLHHTGRSSARRSSLPRYDLRRRVLVSNLNRHIPSQKAKLTHLTALPSKPDTAAPLDLIRDLPNAASSLGKRVKMNCVSSHPSNLITPEKKQESRFRIDPTILRNPIVHTPLKASPPKRRRNDNHGLLRDTMSIHLLKEDYIPPAKKDRIDVPVKDVILAHTTSTGVRPLKDEITDKLCVPTKPVPLPRKSKMGSTSGSKESSRHELAINSHASTDSDSLYARIENCTTGSKQDLVKYGQTGLLSPNFPGRSSALRLAVDQQATSVLRDCADAKKRENSRVDENRAKLRQRLPSNSAGQCRARKSLLFSDGIDSSKAPSGLTLKNIYAAEIQSESPLRDTLSRVPSPPDDRCLRSQPRVLNQSGIYSNNTFVVGSNKLKKDEVDRSYGFACRMRPSLRALGEPNASQILLPSKSAKHEMQMDTLPKRGNTDQAPPLPPPRPVKPPRTMASPKNTQLNLIKDSQVGPTPTTPNREVAIQTSFLVHGADNCPQALNLSAKKRRRSMEIIAEVSAKVKRKGSMLRDKIRRSLELTPGKTASQELCT
ncbi:uncharacterized protein LOC111269832 [Varroa jacobsoni]|uniref:uncharacterized protein LOC111269832 n=1 Tax=Varroa jacobsoni TaxID=62625 RepID=UPI000BF969EC|nr:uncharacterized protein LOC111269832 [Varroa jacobsoni]